MEKEEAIKYIITQYNAGRNEFEISAALQRVLKAPENLVQKFVRITLTEHQRASIIEKTEKIPGVTGHTRSIHDDQIETQTYTDPLEYEKEVDVDRLESIVIQKIKKQQRHNDIVEFVCKETGWTWNRGQRFVARTQTTNHDELSKNQNRFTTLLSIGAILGGLGLLFWAVSILVDYYRAYYGQVPSILSTDFIPLVFLGLFSSLGFISGGTFGIYKTLSNQ